MSFKGWVPTSPKLLELAETRLLHRHLRTPFKVSTVHLPSGETINTLDAGGSDKGENEKRSPLVLTHGFGSGLAMWYLNIDGLCTTGRVLALDWLGMGRSSRPTFGAKRSLLPFFASSKVADAENFFIDSLEAWREKLGLNKIHLLGHSFGGYLAVSYALRYPDRIESLILASPVGIPPVPERKKPDKTEDSQNADRNWTLWFLENLWNWNVTPQALLRLSGPYGHSLFPKIVSARFPNLSPEEREDIWQYLYHISVAQPSGELALNAILSATFNGVNRGIFARTPLSAPDKLPRLVKEKKIPVHLLFGTRDWVYDAFIGPYVKNLQSSLSKPGKIQLHMMENCGHHLYSDDPSKFNSIVNDITTGVI